MSVGAYPSSLRMEWGYNLNKLSVHHTANAERQPTIHDLIHTFRQSWVFSLMKLINFGVFFCLFFTLVCLMSLFLVSVYTFEPWQEIGQLTILYDVCISSHFFYLLPGCLWPHWAASDRIRLSLSYAHCWAAHFTGLFNGCAVRVTPLVPWTT